MRVFRIALVVILAALLVLWATSGSFLLVNDPQPADVIVVLAGETRWRPARGLQMLQQRYAPKMMLDVPTNAIIFNKNTLDIAREYIESLPQRNFISICSIAGLSTKEEAKDVARCLQNSGVKRILIVTSDYHTRRARSTFQHELPEYQISVAAAFDSQQYGVAWWHHRQWAKMNFDEWLRVMWWEVVDRWRK
jgi:uncharacterized SAM-binding protein YcdF (DUF218 family)